MADRNAQLAAYLAPCVQSFWHWADRGEAIAWSSGHTIAFREELLLLLRRFAPKGLPPLGSILVLQAVCRDSWAECSAALGALAGMLASMTRRDTPDWLRSLLTLLDGIHRQRKRWCGTPRAKSELVACILENAPRQVDPDAAAAILAGMSLGLPEELLAPRGTPEYALDALLRDLECLEQGLLHFDPEAFELRLATGLDQLVAPAEVELDPAEQARQLITQLQDDRELAGLGRMAKRLMAAVHLPRPIDDHEELPLGGVSDIANRGPLDRLLLSELAHDGLTLAVRVAMNEALYLRRETPPRRPLRHRTVLVDAGLRLWGLPRVYATAVALAMTAAGDRRIRVDAFRAAGRMALPIDLTHREGLVAHLAALATEAHPAAALESMLAQTAAANRTDAVLITADETLADPEFLHALGQLQLPLLYVIAVNREGRLRIVARGPRGVKPIRAAQLDLEALLQPRSRPTTPLVDAKVPGDLPAIFRVEPFPLALTHAIRPKRMWPAFGGNFLTLTADRRLMLWKDLGHGARQLSDTINARGPLVCWSRQDYDPQFSLAVFGARDLGYRAIVAEAPFAEVHVVEVALAAHPQQVYRIEDLLFIETEKHIEIFELRDGQPVETHPRDVAGHFQWCGGRYFRRGGGPQMEYRAYHFDGRKGAWDDVDRDAVPEHIRQGPPATTPEPALQRMWSGLGAWTLIQGFSAAGVDQGRLALVNRKNDTAWCLELESIRNRLYLQQLPRGARVHLLRQSFTYTAAPPGTAFSLTVAQWPDGSRAWCDSRGLLHLRSSQRAIPEVTLAMCQHGIAGWCADGRTWGPNYFLLGPPTVQAAEIYHEILQPCVAQLR